MTQWPLREAVVFRHLGIAFVVMIVATACGAGTTVTSSPSTTPASPTANPTPAEPPIDAMFDIGNGRKLHLECIGAGSPVIVIDVGGDDTIMELGAGYQPLSEVSRVCGYDRANLGQSDPAPGPRTVEDLGGRPGEAPARGTGAWTVPVRGRLDRRQHRVRPGGEASRGGRGHRLRRLRSGQRRSEPGSAAPQPGPGRLRGRLRSEPLPAGPG